VASFFDRLLDGLDAIGRELNRVRFDARWDPEDVLASHPMARRWRPRAPEGVAEVEPEPEGLGAKLLRNPARVTEAQCPSCRARLRARGELWLCPMGCGVLIPGEIIAHLEADPSLGRDLVEADRGAGEGVASSGVEPVRYRTCPANDGWMQRTNYFRKSGIMIDFCLAHGVWCDPGELRAMVQFLAHRP